MAFKMEPQHPKHDTMLTKHKSLDIWYIEERYGDRRTVLEAWTNRDYADQRYLRYLKATYCEYKRKCANIRMMGPDNVHLIPDESARIVVMYQMNNRTRYKARPSRRVNHIPEEPL